MRLPYCFGMTVEGIVVVMALSLGLSYIPRSYSVAHAQLLFSGTMYTMSLLNIFRYPLSQSCGMENNFLNSLNKCAFLVSLGSMSHLNKALCIDIIVSLYGNRTIISLSVLFSSTHGEGSLSLRNS